MTGPATPLPVMAGLVSAIHVAHARRVVRAAIGGPTAEGVVEGDARNKSGHDGGKWSGHDDRRAAVPRRMSGTGR